MRPNIKPIGIFDSGVGGLTVMKDIIRQLPNYDYLYLGDNARAPYGTRSYETIYQYTLECVQYLFAQGCPLIILACNTASAEALRNIQQKYLPKLQTNRRVLGVIRPTAEVIGGHSKTGHIGVLGTSATVNSQSYIMEILNQSPQLHIFQEACPMWVPLVENHEYDGPGADYFVKRHLQKLQQKSEKIDVLLLACTHFPLLMPKIKRFANDKTTVLSQGEIVASSLKDYLNRHPEIDLRCSKNSRRTYCTTDSTKQFDTHAKIFFGRSVESQFIELNGSINNQK